MIQNAGILFGGLVTAALLVLNVISLIRGRRVFRAPRACRLKYL